MKHTYFKEHQANCIGSVPDMDLKDKATATVFQM